MKIIYSNRIITIESSEYIVVSDIDELIKLIKYNYIFELILDFENEDNHSMEKFVCETLKFNNVSYCLTLPSKDFDICNLPFIRMGDIVKNFAELLICVSRLV